MSYTGGIYGFIAVLDGLMRIDENRIIIDDKVIALHHEIRDARSFLDSIIVLFDPTDFKKTEQPKNLRSYSLDGNENWIAEHPTNQSNDFYASFSITDKITAYNFTGYTCIIDPKTGKLIESIFMD